MAFASASDDGAVRSAARERILDAAYELFSRHGLRAVGVDRIIEESGVARKTFYRHFPSKADLIVAFLDARGQRWSRDWLLAEIQRLGQTPRERLLAAFDVLDGWYRRDDFESCSLIATVFEIRDRSDPIHQEAARQIEAVREIIEELAKDAGARDPEALSHQQLIVMMGATVAATRGDLDAARRARELGELLLQHHGLR
jgi:AcrR family transcriptional regulator